MIMLPDPPSAALFGFGCWWCLVYWLLVAIPEIVAGIEEVVTDETLLQGCWGSLIVSSEMVFWTVTRFVEAALDGGGGVGSVGREAIAIPACWDSWLFIDIGTTVADDEPGNAGVDDNFETEVIGTIKELVVLLLPGVADVVE